jgi:hypothetical protein
VWGEIPDGRQLFRLMRARRGDMKRRELVSLVGGALAWHIAASGSTGRTHAQKVTVVTFLLLVTWLAYGQPPSDYQVPSTSNEACEAARLQLIKDAERIGQAMIERANAQDRQIGGNNKTALSMAAISNAPYVSAVCVQTSAS